MTETTTTKMKKETTTTASSIPDVEKKNEQTLPFFQLFSFADKYVWLLMSAGSLCAFVHGSAMPVFFLLFGVMVNGYGKNQSDLNKLTQEVSKEERVKERYKQLMETLIPVQEKRRPPRVLRRVGSAQW